MEKLKLISIRPKNPDGSTTYPNATASQVDALMTLLPNLPQCRLDYETPDGLTDSILPEQLCAQTAEELADVEEIVTGLIPELCGSNLTLVFQTQES